MTRSSPALTPRAALCLAWGAAFIAATAGALTLPAPLTLAPAIVATLAAWWGRRNR